MASLKPRHTNGKMYLDQFTKKLFSKNIVEARKSQGESVENFDFNKTRCKVLTKNESIKDNSSGILYWMMRDCRVQDNWAMIYSQRLALKHKVPLNVCFTTKDLHNLYPTKRHLTFLIEGLKTVIKQCGELNIGFFILNCTPKDLAKCIVQNNIGGVVVDFSPLRLPIKLKESLLEHLPDDVPVVQVDAHNIVPVWVVSNKQEGMAKLIRTKINKNLPEYLSGFPNISKQTTVGNFRPTNLLTNIDDILDCYVPKWNVPEVQWGEGAGEEAGLGMLYSFIISRLKYYGITSNDPAEDNTSKLSPWINFGQISAQRCALEIESMKSVFKEQCEKYLEELIIRRELTDNYCYYNINYDNIKGASKWAQDSLKIHA